MKFIRKILVCTKGTIKFVQKVQSSLYKRYKLYMYQRVPTENTFRN